MSTTTYYKGRINYAITYPDDMIWDKFYNYGDYYTFTDLPSQFLRSGIKLPIKMEPYYGSQLKLTYYDSYGNTHTVIDTKENIYNTLVNTVFSGLIFTETMYGHITFYYDGVDDKDLIDLYVNKMVFPDENTIMLYLLKSSKNTVSKSLLLVGGITGNFPRAISKKVIELDLTDYDELGNFNYVYVSLLKRYYYVKDVSMIAKAETVTLIEDVLMSFKDLILLQTAYVERNENNYDLDKSDNLVTYDYDKTVTKTTITATFNLFATQTTEKIYALTFVAKVS